MSAIKIRDTSVFPQINNPLFPLVGDWSKVIGGGGD